MQPVLRPDLCVIGAGPGGFAVAAAAALFGLPVVLVTSPRIDGHRSDRGAAAIAALAAAGVQAGLMRRAPLFGLRAGAPKVNHEGVHEHVRRVLAAAEAESSLDRLAALGVRVIEAEPRFFDARTLLAGEQPIAARRYVIAVGSEPALPPIPGLPEVEHWTEDTIADLTQSPEHLIVIGAGRAGLTLAQAYRRLGSDVTVLPHGPGLGREDPEIAAYAVSALRREGVVIHGDLAVKRVLSEAGGRVRVVFSRGGREETLAGTHLLLAVGRRPLLDGLDLEAAGVRHGEHGLSVGAGLRTANRRIHAIGECIPGFAEGLPGEVAKDQARAVIASALFRMSRKVDETLIPRVILTDPEIASVGLTEEEARARHGRIRILRWPFSEGLRARAEHAPSGEVKAIVHPRGRIFGCSIVGPRAGELIVPWALAIAQGLTVKHLAGLPSAGATLSEASHQAALAFQLPAARSEWIRGIVRLLRHFG